MNIEKIKQIAREKYGRELTDEQATKYANSYGRLTDNELDNVAGGSCEDNLKCPKCNAKLKYEDSANGIDLVCSQCGHIC